MEHSALLGVPCSVPGGLPSTRQIPAVVDSAHPRASCQTRVEGPHGPDITEYEGPHLVLG
eukprot:3130313-Alexandrium_andersonii.AAC.1